MTAQNPLNFSELQISWLIDKNCLSGFYCGESEIDRWAKSKAAKWAEHGRAKVYVAKFRGNHTGCAFYSLSFIHEKSHKLIEQRDRDIWTAGAPMIYIDYVAVQKNIQKNGLGRYLLMDALMRCHMVSRHVAVYGIGLRSLNAETTRLYTKLGFAIAPNEKEHPLMILPIWTLNDLIG